MIRFFANHLQRKVHMITNSLIIKINSVKLPVHSNLQRTLPFSQFKHSFVCQMINKQKHYITSKSSTISLSSLLGLIYWRLLPYCIIRSQGIKDKFICQIKQVNHNRNCVPEQSIHNSDQLPILQCMD